MDISKAHVTFEDKSHTYRNSKTNKKYISVTTLLGRYERGFDGEYWSYYKSLQAKLRIVEKSAMSRMMRNYGVNFNALDFNLLVGIIQGLGFTLEQLKPKAIELLEEWEKKRDDACARGNKYHDEKEANAYKDGYMVIGGVRETTQIAYSFDLSQLADGGYRELLVYSHEYEVSGKADMVLLETLPVGGGVYKTFADIDDDKTNAKLTFDGFSYYKHPISHLKECKFNKHALQMSMYMYMLEKNGFVPRDLQFSHAIFDEHQNHIRTDDYPLPYLREEVINILNHHKQYYVTT